MVNSSIGERESRQVDVKQILGTFPPPHSKSYIPTEGLEKLLGNDIVAKCNL